MSGKGTGKGYGLDMPAGDYGDTVTIVVPRKCAEDLYYALAMAMGGSGLDMEPAWAPGKSGGKRGKTDAYPQDARPKPSS